MVHGSYPSVRRIELPNGQWWEIYAEVTRGMRKAFRKAAFTSFAGGLAKNETLDVTDAEGMRKAAAQHPEGWDINAIDDAYLLHGTHAWSYAIPPSQEGIDSLPENVTEQVLRAMRSIYEEVGGEVRKN